MQQGVFTIQDPQLEQAIIEIMHSRLMKTCKMFDPLEKI